jgi:hypothetical protein
MNLLAPGDTVRSVALSMQYEPDFALQRDKSQFETHLVTMLLRKYTPRALYCFWFFEAFYASFAKQLTSISSKFAASTATGVEQLLSFKADM